MFGGDPSIVGKNLTLNGLGAGTGELKNQFEVVGVLGPDFLLNDEIMPTVASIRQMDVFLPLPFAADAVTTRRGDENFNVMARLKPGVTMAQADEDIGAIAARIRDKDKRDRTFTIDVVPLVESVVGDVRRAVLVLLGLRRAGPAHRVRERRQSAADARDRPAERSRGPHRAWRRLAAPGASASHRESAARPARRRRGTPDREGRVVRRPHRQSRQHSAS